MQRKQLIPSKFGLNTSRSSGGLPVRTIEIDEIAPLGTNAFEESVRLDCFAAKRAEQIELERAEAESTGHILGESNASRHPAPHHAD
jgi:hypothetical protein